MLIEEVKIETGESTRTVKDLRKELKDLKDQLLNTQQGTEEYSETMRKAANIQKELKDQMLEVNNSAMDFGQKVGNITKTMSGLSGAITAATGAMSLFGIENEEAQRKITATMTSLIGITQGLSKMDDGVKAFKRLTIAINASSKSLGVFKTALAATGIGALVVVLGSVISYWDEFTQAIGLSSDKLQHLGDIARGVFNVITSSLKGIASALGKMIKGDFKGAWQELKDGFNVVQNFNDGVAESVAKREEEMTKKAQEEADKRAQIAAEEAKKRIEATAKLAKYERDMAQAQLRGEDAEKYSEKNRQIQERYFETMFALYKEDSEEYKNLVLEKEQWLQDWENHLLEQNKEGQTEDPEAKKQEEQKKARARALEDFNESLKSEQQLLKERYDMLVQAAKEAGQATTDIEQWYEDEKNRIHEEGLKKEQALNKLRYQSYRTMALTVGDILGNMSDMMADGTEEQKGLAIAATTINMLVGIQEALSGVWTTHSGIWDIALAAAQAASIATSGIATISKIQQVRPDGSGPGPVSTPPVSIPTVINASPDFSQTVDGAMTQTSIRDQRVFVLEHDITDTQKKVEVAESRAAY